MTTQAASMDLTTATSEQSIKKTPITAPPSAAGGSYFYDFAHGFLSAAFRLHFDLKSYGVQNVPASGGLLLVANHESFLDPPAIAVATKREISFFAKSELFSNKFFGGLIRKLNAFPVRLGEGDLTAMREAIKRMKEGGALLAFPEGGRTFDGKFQPLQPGVALMIRRANVPVVAVAVDGSFESMPRAQGDFRQFPLRVSFGKPMRLANLPADQILQTLDREMQRLLLELRATPHPELSARHIRRRQLTYSRGAAIVQKLAIEPANEPKA